MYNYDRDEIDRLQRIIDGRPPRKEITLPADAIMTRKEVSKSAMDAWKKAVRKVKNG